MLSFVSILILCMYVAIYSSIIIIFLSSDLKMMLNLYIEAKETNPANSTGYRIDSFINYVLNVSMCIYVKLYVCKCNCMYITTYVCAYRYMLIVFHQFTSLFIYSCVHLSIYLSIHPLILIRHLHIPLFRPKKIF